MIYNIKISETKLFEAYVPIIEQILKALMTCTSYTNSCTYYMVK